MRSDKVKRYKWSVKWKDMLENKNGEFYHEDDDEALLEINKDISHCEAINIEVIRGLERQLAANEERIHLLETMVRSVTVDIDGIYTMDINGKNWFDLRVEALKGDSDEL